MSVILSVNNLTKVYGREFHLGPLKLGRKVVGARKVTFSVNQGEIFGFLGPNGAGKTTCMRAVLDYLKIEGNVTIFGLDHHHESLTIRKRVGYIPGDLALYENFTGNELINYYDSFRPVHKKFLTELRQIFRADLTLKIGALSSGNRQQVGLIVALASKPDLLILDEPTSGLDPLIASRFHSLLRRLKDEGITIFLSSHDLAEVQAVCDRVGIIKDGRIILVENVEDLREKFMQNVRITFQNEASMPSVTELESIDSVISVDKIKKRSFTLQVKEDINDFIQVISGYKIKRLSIEDASLEEIFLQYYE